MITIHSANAADLSGLGLGALAPSEVEMEERAGGMYELRMTHPMDEGGKWCNIAQYRILRAPAPVRETPLVTLQGSALQDVWEVNVRTRLRLRTAPSVDTGRIIARYRDGTRVVKVGQQGDWFRVIVSDGGAAGWRASG